MRSVLGGWRRIDWRALAHDLRREMKEDQVTNGAAALAFYMVLAIFPAAIFGLSLLSYLPIPHLEDAIMDVVRDALPPGAAQMFNATVTSLVSNRQGGLLSFGFVFAVVSASNGMYAIMQQLNDVYDVTERRSFFRARGVSFLLMLVFLVLLASTLALVIFGGVLQAAAARALDSGPGLLAFFAALRWIVIGCALQLGFALVYKLAPNTNERFALFAPGTLFATVGLLGASAAFKLYAGHFADYNALYGSLGAVIVLLTWLFLAGWVLLVGGEINALYDRALTRGRTPRGDSGAIIAATSP